MKALIKYIHTVVLSNGMQSTFQSVWPANEVIGGLSAVCIDGVVEYHVIESVLSTQIEKQTDEIINHKQQAEKLAERYNSNQITFCDMLIELDKINKESDLFIYVATPLRDGSGCVKIDKYVNNRYIK